MSVIKILFQLFLIYMVYKFVFHFIIPLYKTTKHMKSKVSEMNARMQEQERQQQQQKQQQAAPTAVQKPVEKDYIDFEELK